MCSQMPDSLYIYVAYARHFIVETMEMLRVLFNYLLLVPSHRNSSTKQYEEPVWLDKKPQC